MGPKSKRNFMTDYSECSLEQYILLFFIIASDSGMCVSQNEQATIFCPESKPTFLLSVGLINFLKRVKPIQPSNITNINLINETTPIKLFSEILKFYINNRTNSNKALDLITFNIDNRA